MFRSAASLALNAGLFREAEKMITVGLSGNPPEPIADELRNLYENINFEKHLRLKGVTLSDIHNIDVSEMEDILIYGKLDYADASKGDIRLKTDEGESYIIFVPKVILADIVKLYWEQYVTIRGRKQDKKIFFKDLQAEK